MTVTLFHSQFDDNGKGAGTVTYAYVHRLAPRAARALPKLTEKRKPSFMVHANPKSGDGSPMRLEFGGGDGDQSYFGEPFSTERVEEDWFPAVLERGPAWLVRILNGHHCGEYLALTSRVRASLEEQMAVRDLISVVVQLVRNPGPGFVETETTMPPIGMTAVEVVKSELR